MTAVDEQSLEIFSFHLAKIPFVEMSRHLLSPIHGKGISGLNHSESFFAMNLGEPMASSSRYGLTTFVFFAWWKRSDSLKEFLKSPSYGFLNEGWHLQMKLYRSWGEVTELKNAFVNSDTIVGDKPIVAATLARLNLRHTARFIRWGKPVEQQVRDHRGQSLALAGLRPLNTFSTFSIWKNETEMSKMVHGDSHHLAMRERIRKDFHHEFSTMRFIPLKETGAWNGKSGFVTAPTPDQ